MQFDISKIITDHVNQMQESGELDKLVTTALARVISSTISNAIDNYKVASAIRDALEKQVGDIAADCGIPAYNARIAEKAKAIVNDLYEKDFADRMAEKMQQTLLNKRESVKLSEIFEAFCNYYRENVDPSDQSERETFTAECEHQLAFSSLARSWIIRFDEEPDKERDCSVYFPLTVWDTDEYATIRTLYMNGRPVDAGVSLGFLSTPEALVLNCYYNQTPIIFDIDPDTIDCCYYVED